MRLHWVQMINSETLMSICTEELQSVCTNGYRWYAARVYRMHDGNHRLYTMREINRACSEEARESME